MAPRCRYVARPRSRTVLFAHPTIAMRSAPGSRSLVGSPLDAKQELAWLDKLFGDQDSDEVTIFIAKRHELARGDIVRFDAPTGPTSGTRCVQ
jgi:hypothetical protein